METFLVGGAVRDELLGLGVKDRDWVVVGATPEEMRRKGFKQVGADFPVFLHPESREEYALARTERKQGHGYHGFTIYSAPDVTLEQDLKRRDLTINAMARSPDGEIIDPFDGQRDLENRQLRHVSEAFAEDPLRILRTARFAARLAPMGFQVAPDTMALMHQMVEDGEVNHLVPERVWQEIQRALHEQAPVAFFQVLRDCAALAVLIPELSDDTRFCRAMAALECVDNNRSETDARFAALMSPLESTQAKHRAAALKAPNDCRDMAWQATELMSGLQALDPSSSEAILQILDAADAWRRPDRFDRLLDVLRCTLEKSMYSTLDLIRKSYLLAAEVKAKELLAKGFKGKALGEAIREERLRHIDSLIE